MSVTALQCGWCRLGVTLTVSLESLSCVLTINTEGILPSNSKVTNLLLFFFFIFSVQTTAPPHTYTHTHYKDHEVINGTSTTTHVIDTNIEKPQH